MRDYFGMENKEVCDLVLAFLRTPIKDKEGNDYSNGTKGMAQGSPLSPVLMNIYLHELDR